jgi:dTDP-4-dehydrorhamnose reductase
MKNKVLIFGSSGLLGGEFVGFLSKDKKNTLFKYDSRNSNISDFEQVLKIIKKIRPDIVINCAAKINIDSCEADPLGAWMANSIGPGNIARSLKLLDKKAIFLHISTSDVFDGRVSTGYRENSEAKPINVYSWSKFVGEKIIEEELKNSKLIKYFIIRTGWLYGESRKTFIDVIMDSLASNKSFEVVSDQRSVPTWTRDLVECAALFITNKKFKGGIYHLINNCEKSVSKFEVGVFISKMLGAGQGVIKKGYCKSIFKTIRPQNTILINSKIRRLPDWKRSLINYLNLKYGQGLNLK